MGKKTFQIIGEAMFRATESGCCRCLGPRKGSSVRRCHGGFIWLDSVRRIWQASTFPSIYDLFFLFNLMLTFLQRFQVKLMKLFTGSSVCGLDSTNQMTQNIDIESKWLLNDSNECGIELLFYKSSLIMSEKHLISGCQHLVISRVAICTAC